MTTDLEKELQESIKKHLPGQVGDVLKERLEQADRDAAIIVTLNRRIEELNQQVMTANQTVATYQKFDERNATLEAREEKLKEDEKNLDVETLKYQLASEKDKTLFSQNVALGLVRNTQYRKTIFDSENAGGSGVVDGQGHYHYPTHTSKSYDETQTKE